MQVGMASCTICVVRVLSASLDCLSSPFAM